ncbi:long-chain fatty acid--CoA ligase [Halorarius litoreus]|uniref:long-chain fatty acid--CoA ligase n=1 Tax=Halorarius litoreus TaxID=2962676 RepID=UPI0020CD7B8A|nr:long-chain fatty acid--CoA ligase [Halorarius litoreus]
MVGSNQLIRSFLWRAAQLYPDVDIVSRTGDAVHRYDYRAYGERVAQLANALAAAGIEPGDRVGSLCWNHHRHFETYFGVPCMGAQLHTINPNLPESHVEHIVGDAADELLFVDPHEREVLEALADSEAFESVQQYVVMGDTVPETSLDPVVDYESFIAGHEPSYDWPDVDESQPAGMCYTSGTTGKPKGVEYTQQMIWSYTMTTLTPQMLGITDHDVVMPLVPMFHSTGWGFSWAATAAGAKQVYPGPSPDSATLARLIEEEGVTLTAGVPTIWIDLLEYLETHDADISSLERIVAGGAPVPESLIRRLDEEYDVEVLQAWGMTELTAIGTIAHLPPDIAAADVETRYAKRQKQGRIVPGLEFRVVSEDDTEVPWDDTTVGELYVRGPSVTTEYYQRPEANAEDFAANPGRDGDGEGNEWLATGDLVTVDAEGYISLVDRDNDIIKSGGEWISSVELENAMMAHDAVSEATVVGVSHERYQERPLGFVVMVDGASIEPDALRAELSERIRADYPKWWTPDEIQFVDEIPRTATGKFDKMALRGSYADHDVETDLEPEE